MTCENPVKWTVSKHPAEKKPYLTDEIVIEIHDGSVEKAERLAAIIAAALNAAEATHDDL